MERIVINILAGEHTREEDVPIVFGDMEGEVEGSIMRLESDIPMSVILRDLGIFKSSSQARKSGWNFNMSKGYSEYPKIGKLRHSITIWNPTE